MSGTLRMQKTLALLGAGLLLAGAVHAADAPTPTAKKAAPRRERLLAPGGKWFVGDMARPQPRVVDPGTPSSLDKPGQPPSDAIVLFDGKDLSRWEGKTGAAPTWLVEDGYMIKPDNRKPGNDIMTKDEFGSCQLHIEWATPEQVDPRQKSQGRGNSGVFLFGNGELQVLDSFQNPTYADGSAGALYGKYPPLVNASRKPGQWQSYDVIIEMAKFDAQQKLVSPVKITVLHNGVVVHHAVDNGGRAEKGKLVLQDHINRIRFRNIWLRPLKGYDEQ